MSQPSEGAGCGLFAAGAAIAFLPAIALIVNSTSCTYEVGQKDRDAEWRQLLVTEELAEWKVDPSNGDTTFEWTGERTGEILLPSDTQ